jgi:hypothetical protein
MDDYFDRANRHDVYIQRLATQLLNENVFKSLSKAYRAARSALLDAESITSITQLNKIISVITGEVKAPIELSWDDVTGELSDFAAYEAGFQASVLGGVAGISLSIPADKRIMSYINRSLMSLSAGNQVRAGAWSDFVAENTSSTIKTYNNQIKAGFAGGETVHQIVKRLRDITNGIMKNNAEALVRTGINHYAINAREAMAQDNADVITGKYINTVFDNRRSLICTGYAAQQDARSKPWALDDPSAPVFPAHFNCRTNYLYLVNNQTHPDGTRQAVGGKKTHEAEDRYNRRKDSLDSRRENPDIEGATSSKVKYRGRKDSDTFNAGQIAGDTSAAAWLRNQPKWFVESNLGKARADLFLSGKIKLEKLTDMTGRPLTIKELIDSGV